MQLAAAALTEEEMKRLAVHFTAMPGLAQRPIPTLAVIAKGDPARQLPACVNCHAPGRNAPFLSGQKRTYLAARLRHWQGDPTVVDARKSADGMAVIARRIPPEQIDAIAAAFAEP
jgi:cytochrome c553